MNDEEENVHPHYLYMHGQIYGLYNAKMGYIRHVDTPNTSDHHAHVYMKILANDFPQKHISFRS